MKNFLLLFCLASMASLTYGQKLNPIKAVANQVETFYKQQTDFTNVDMLNHVSSLSDDSRGEGWPEQGELLTLESKGLRHLHTTQPQLIRMELPAEAGKSISLDLYKVELFTPDFQVKTSDGNVVEVEYGTFYRGIIKDDFNSLVALSVFPNEIKAMVASDAGQFELSRIQDSETQYAWFKAPDQDGLGCQMADDGPAYTEQELSASSSKTGDCIRVYVETDKDIYQNKGSVQNVINWVGGLFNESATLYANENISTAISTIYVWTGNSPYKGNSSNTILNNFQSNRTSFDGDLAILLNLKNIGGLAAGFSGLCNSNSANSMAVAGVYSTYSSVPSWSWSVFLISHELGHLYGSRHTHACVWNGNNTAIDGCAGGTEGSCSTPGNPSGGGTIMSYCYNTSVGVNFNYGFGSQPGNVIRNNVTGANCTSASCGGGGNPGPSCSNGIQDGDETGVDCGGSCSPCQSGSCDAPSGLSATNIKRNRAKLNWGSVSAANDYTVQIRQSGSSSWSNATTSGTSITASSLSNNTSYEWQVRSNCSGSSSTYSAICSFTAGQSNSGGCSAAMALEMNLNVWPNPANQQLNIDVPALEGTCTITMTDLLGNQLLSQNANGKTQVSVAGFAPGVYFIQAQLLNGERLVQKVVVE